jgi:hypothetical protein
MTMRDRVSEDEMDDLLGCCRYSLRYILDEMVSATACLQNEAVLTTVIMTTSCYHSNLYRSESQYTNMHETVPGSLAS